MAVTAKMVQELRASTGAGLMDCKKALEATSGDLEAAVDHLRKQGLKSAAKKAERETAEGRIGSSLTDDRRRGTLVSVACETDFLAKGEGFKAFVGELEEHVLSQDPDGLENGERPLLSQPWKGSGPSVSEKLQETIGSLKENIRFADFARLVASEGRVGSYVHHDGKQAALVAVETEATVEGSEGFLKALCQHLVVFAPPYLSRNDVPEEDVEREREVIRDSDEVKKKPEEFRDKIVEGKLGKFYSQTCLEEQPWIHDDKSSVQKAMEKELGKGARILAFRRLRIS